MITIMTIVVAIMMAIVMVIMVIMVITLGIMILHIVIITTEHWFVRIVHQARILHQVKRLLVIVKVPFVIIFSQMLKFAQLEAVYFLHSMEVAPTHDCARNDQCPANGAQHDSRDGASVGAATLPGGTGEVTSLVVHIGEDGVVQASDSTQHAWHQTEQGGKEGHHEMTPFPLGPGLDHPGNSW